MKTEKILKHNENNRRWRKNNYGKVKKYNKQWWKNNPEKVNEIKKRFDEKHLGYYKQYQKQWRKDNSEKVIAHNLANKVYPEVQVCSVSGCNNIGERHHPDYEKPLEIEWLCTKHHRAHHSELVSVA
jgi:hypothetical protein